MGEELLVLKEKKDEIIALLIVFFKYENKNSLIRTKVEEVAVLLTIMFFFRNMSHFV